ncbi:MAG: SGNH/GDSL hydrolase family protein [Prosthecobacter sp.]
MNRVFCFCLVLTASAFAGDLQLTLPPVVYATPDVPMSIYHDNIVLTETPQDYRFEFTCDIGKNEAQHWTVTPADSDVGDHPIAITVKDASGRVLEQGKTTLHVSPRQAGEGKSLRLLIIGDSLTNASAYPNEIARLLALPGNPKFTLLGTHQPTSAKPGVVHEGYGGWKWSDFLVKFTAPTPGVTAGPLARKSTSPFIFPAAGGKTGVFDLNRYFKEHCDNQPPDVVTFLLGINDCFGADPQNPDVKINEVLDNADKLLAEFHKAAPKAVLAVGLTTPPNSRESGFEANYKGKYHRWGWKRIQHRLVQRMLERLSNRESEGIYIVPTELNLDPVTGYPDNNGVHPNATGYAQIGASFYSWVKSRW